METQLKTIEEKHKDILKSEGFDFTYCEKNKQLYIAKGYSSIFCSYNIIALSTKEDGESYDINAEDFINKMKFIFLIDGLKFASGQRYVHFKLQTEKKKEISLAIKFFIEEIARTLRL